MFEPKIKQRNTQSIRKFTKYFIRKIAGLYIYWCVYLHIVNYPFGWKGLLKNKHYLGCYLFSNIKRIFKIIFKRIIIETLLDIFIKIKYARTSQHYFFIYKKKEINREVILIIAFFKLKPNKYFYFF